MSKFKKMCERIIISKKEHILPDKNDELIKYVENNFALVDKDSQLRITEGRIKGNKNRWDGISKEERSRRMREVVKKRWQNKKSDK